jgi:MerR family transcriptional regulator, copper efflux regulator
LPPYGGPGACASPTGIVQRRIAALDGEIARLTVLRDQLAARIATEPARR